MVCIPVKNITVNGIEYEAITPMRVDGSFVMVVHSERASVLVLNALMA